MLKRQDSRVSSSRRQTPEPEKRPGHAKTVGCMSGIFQLISKYQNSHKLLTFGKKVERKSVTVTPRAEIRSITVTKQANMVMMKDEEKVVCGMFQNMDPRISPMISPKLRRPEILPEKEPEKDETSEKKRQRLLEALEKCNEDLEALKMIIMSVQPNDQKPVQSHRLNYVKREEENCLVINSCENEENNQNLRSMASSFTTNFTAAVQSRLPQTKTRPEKDKGIGARRYSKFVRRGLPFRMHRKPISLSIWASKAMVQSVEEVCNDTIWGEKREVADIAVILHNYICKDLIEETIEELGYQKPFPLPLHGCKRRLSF